MKTIKVILAICFTVSLSTVLHAQQVDSTHLKKKPHAKEFTPEQKKMARQAMAAKWDSLPSDQKAAIKEGLKASRKHRLENMTPEQREAMRAKMKARYESLSPQQKEKIKQRIEDRMNAIDSTKRKN
jgi:hypothetical protein